MLATETFDAALAVVEEEKDSKRKSDRLAAQKKKRKAKRARAQARKQVWCAANLLRSNADKPPTSFPGILRPANSSSPSRA